MQKQQPLEAETFNFKVLIDCSNQQNLKKLKEAISCFAYKKFFKSFGYPGLVFTIDFVIIFINSIWQSCIPSSSFSK